MRLFLADIIFNLIKKTDVIFIMPRIIGDVTLKNYVMADITV